MKFSISQSYQSEVWTGGEIAVLRETADVLELFAGVEAHFTCFSPKIHSLRPRIKPNVLERKILDSIRESSEFGCSQP